MRKIFWIVFITLLFLSSTFVYFKVFKKNYRIFEVKEAPLVKAVYATGYIKAYNEVEVKSRVAGYVVKVYKDVGEIVKKGEVLAELENKPLERKIEEVKTELENLREKLSPQSYFITSFKEKIAAKKERIEELKYRLQRRKKLYEKGLISREEIFNLEKQYNAQLKELSALELEFKENVKEIKRKIKVLKATLNRLKEELEQYKIKSPISGVILKRNVEVGDYVNTFMETKPLFVIGDLRKLKTILEIDEEYSYLVRLGQKVYITIDSVPDRVYEGRIIKIYRKVNEKKKSFEVEVEADYDVELFSGTTVEANIIISEKLGVAIPKEAIFEENKVRVIEKGKIVERVIKLGETYGDMVEVLEGLKSGEKVLIEK
ncbi:MAG TPA: efflux RND transporter periplasmic adaptor subunit [Aquifex aeolicus]|nr:efflux RND transporter periplasmic adaptor subunit [Aquifex aeolicus]